MVVQVYLSYTFVAFQISSSKALNDLAKVLVFILLGVDL